MADTLPTCLHDGNKIHAASRDFREAKEVLTCPAFGNICDSFFDPGLRFLALASLNRVPVEFWPEPDWQIFHSFREGMPYQERWRESMR
ncbi:hypothetical protein LGN19_29735 [Burkholderia sp. AU30198]|uniref:hypothetical protein n=1 Tax=Burkholderia sp. AU30198 TaxID=2879627 RepID=UPI001CF4C1EA|nr:hypothetical protein [Burkholderia sp. AU30198]MCA8297980.1 hypothetical protein [Burkholderia sp. AU30198]